MLWMNNSCYNDLTIIRMNEELLNEWPTAQITQYKTNVIVHTISTVYSSKFVLWDHLEWHLWVCAEGSWFRQLYFLAEKIVKYKERKGKPKRTKWYLNCSVCSCQNTFNELWTLSEYKTSESRAGTSDSSSPFNQKWKRSFRNSWVTSKLTGNLWSSRELLKY